MYVGILLFNLPRRGGRKQRGFCLRVSPLVIIRRIRLAGNWISNQIDIAAKYRIPISHWNFYKPFLPSFLNNRSSLFETMPDTWDILLFFFFFLFSGTLLSISANLSAIKVRCHLRETFEVPSPLPLSEPRRARITVEEFL